MMKAWLVGFAIVESAWMAGARAEASPIEARRRPAADAQVLQADTPAVKAALARIEKLHGTIKRNDDNQVIAVDLFECKATNADVEQLVKSLPDLVALKLWGADINDQGPNRLRRSRI